MYLDMGVTDQKIPLDQLAVANPSLFAQIRMTAESKVKRETAGTALARPEPGGPSAIPPSIGGGATVSGTGTFVPVPKGEEGMNVPVLLRSCDGLGPLSMDEMMALGDGDGGKKTGGKDLRSLFYLI